MNPRRFLPALFLLFIGSGCAALIYEIVWFQLLQLIIGSSSISLGILLGTFMGGMCVGSLLMPRLISARRHPLRVYAAHASEGRRPAPEVSELIAREQAEGLCDPERYRRFARDAEESKRALLDLLIRLRREGKHVVGYGAPGKGNTLLYYCGIRTDFLDYTVDRNPYKHGRFTPGTHIPIHDPSRIAETRPRKPVNGSCP